MNNGATIFLAASMALMAAQAFAEQPGKKRWEGYYAGIGVGGAAVDTKADTLVTPGGTYFNYTQDAPQLVVAGDEHMLQGRFSGGLFGGYNHRINNILIGVEASANSLYLNDTKSSRGIFDSDPNINFIVKQTIDANWQETLRLRLGYVQDNWLAYVTGGAAASQVTYKAAYYDDNAMPGFAGAYGRDRTSKTIFGVVLGFGGEYVLNDDWSVRGDYLFTNFDKVRAAYNMIPTPTLDEFSSAFEHQANLRTHSLLIGLAYHF